MKNIFKCLYSYLVTFMETIVSILTVVLFSKFNSNCYFKKMRDTQRKGAVCDILCNGPSLNQYLDNYRDDDNKKFAVNFFGTTSHFRIIRPDMYIVLDNILIGRADREYSVEMVQKLYEELQAVDWPMIFFYPSNGNMDIIRRLRENTNVSIVIYNMTPVTGFKIISHWLFKHSLGMPLPQNISNAAVFCALNAGYKKINLYGVEHSWLKSFDIHPETHKLYMNDGHFYEKENIRWFAKGDYMRWTFAIYKVMKSHFALREYADSINAKIINKTSTSFVEAYEFEEY